MIEQLAPLGLRQAAQFEMFGQLRQQQHIENVVSAQTTTGQCQQTEDQIHAGIALPQGAVGDAHRQVARITGAPRPLKRRQHQGREARHIRCHDQDVARLDGGVGCHQAQQRFMGGFHLPPIAMAGQHLQVQLAALQLQGRLHSR